MRWWLSFLACSGLQLAVAEENLVTSPSSSPAPIIAPASSDSAKPTTEIKTAAEAKPLLEVKSAPSESAPQKLPYMEQANYLLQHHDELLAIAYLREIATNGHLPSENKSQVIIRLADCLFLRHEDGEALYWLKIWMGLYSSRPEAGAVTYRMGLIYERMNMPQLARDTYYTALSSTLNQGKVQNADSLKYYTLLTDTILWSIAQNEYRSGEWQRAADLFERFEKEAHPEQVVLLENAAFLDAECYYQLKKIDQAQALYEKVLTDHPFNSLAPEARLHLYHLYLLKKEPERAEQELEALSWTVRTVWPKSEEYWKQRTAELILALNQKDPSTLSALLKSTAYLSNKNNSWSQILNHYDKLSIYQGSSLPLDDKTSDWKPDVQKCVSDDEQLKHLHLLLDQVLPALPPLSPTPH